LDKSGEWKVKEDPRSFTYKSVGQRMIIVSAGVAMNIVFAAVAFMIVFMVGLETVAPEVGLVLADSPAEAAGIRNGDVITAINGKAVKEFDDIRPSVILSAPGEKVDVTIERPDPNGGTPKTMTFDMEPKEDPEEGRLQLGIAPAMTNEVVVVLNDPYLPPDEEQIKPGDKIVRVAGTPVSKLTEIKQLIVRAEGEYVPILIERPTAGGASEDVNVIESERRALLTFRPTTGERGKGNGHLCGFVPRRVVQDLYPDDAAAKAGIKSGDVIANWDGQIAPTFVEIVESVSSNEGDPIPVTVLRPGENGAYQAVEIPLVPRRKGIFGRGDATIGMQPSYYEERKLVVADIETTVSGKVKTPAAALKDVMPRGSLITKINDEQVATWHELLKRFIALAGTNIKVDWQTPDGQEQSGSIYIPHTIGTTFDLPPHHAITKIGDLTSIEIKEGARPTVVNTWRGAMEALRQYIGQEIDIQHRDLIDWTPHTDRVTVTEEMLDTWVMRTGYETDIYLTDFYRILRRESNPIAAMMLGMKKTWRVIESVYMMVRRTLVTRSVPMDTMSGPVGIIQMGSEIADRSLVVLLWFLALISANLAVLNFMPFPIVDGGLFVFLIIEKIKGSPLSLRVQMATQLVGLVLIIGGILYITYNDIARFFN
jgi:RIP metalloprotease RseP